MELRVLPGLFHPSHLAREAAQEVPELWQGIRRNGPRYAGKE
jgi:hypothetical protein